MLEISFNGQINKQLTMEKFIVSINDTTIIKLFDSIVNKKPKQVVYTSFNGDFLDYINHMVYVALKLGYTPINPECALGYFLSTTTHNNSKIETMLDCISLELLCDELWLFLERPTDSTSYPEGVAAEIMAWLNSKPNANMCMRVFNNEIVKSFNTVATIRDNVTPIHNFYNDNPKYEEVNISSIINNFDEFYYNELVNRLIGELKTNKRNCIYISTDFYDIKYSDWVRKYLYERNLVGILPSQLLNSFVLNFAYKDELIKSYLTDRYSLLTKVNELYFIQKPNAGNKFSIDFLFDVYYWLLNSKKYYVQFYDWGKFEVPKFTSRWALTTKEHSEVWE